VACAPCNLTLDNSVEPPREGGNHDQADPKNDRRRDDHDYQVWEPSGEIDGGRAGCASGKQPPEDCAAYRSGLGPSVSLTAISELGSAELGETTALIAVIFEPSASIRVLPPLFDGLWTCTPAERLGRKLDEFSTGERSGVLELAPQGRVEFPQPPTPSTRS
jgi:hypothetical protein